MIPDKFDALTEHYQNTYKLTYRFWNQRNRLFLYLISVTTVASILTYRPMDANPLLVAWIGKLLGIATPEGLNELGRSFPFALLHLLLLIVVFYLMVNLCHRNLYILRNYRYLGALEAEIRQMGEFKPDSVAFTRESIFYWGSRPWILGSVKWAYVILLGSLIGMFLWGRFATDIDSSNKVLVGVDALVSIPIIGYFVGYAWYTLKGDSVSAS